MRQVQTLNKDDKKSGASLFRHRHGRVSLETKADDKLRDESIQTHSRLSVTKGHFNTVESLRQADSLDLYIQGGKRFKQDRPSSNP